MVKKITKQEVQEIEYMFKEVFDQLSEGQRKRNQGKMNEIYFFLLAVKNQAKDQKNKAIH